MVSARSWFGVVWRVVRVVTLGFSQDCRGVV